MTLEILNKDMVVALKEGNKARKDVLASLVGAVKKAAIDQKVDRTNVPEDIVNEVLLKEQKTVSEMIAGCPATRTDLLEQYRYNLSVIDEYAPILMGEEADVRNYINEIIQNEPFNGVFTNKNRGTLMKALKGKVDMTVANKIVAQMLNKEEDWPMKGYSFDSDTGCIFSFDDTNKVVQTIQDNLKYRDEKIAELIAENTRLKADSYKDEELFELKKKLQLLQEKNQYGFSITRNDFDNIQQWKISHNSTYHNNDSSSAIGGRFYYEFIPTSIGTIGTCICSQCRFNNKPKDVYEFTFQDLN